MRLEPLTPSPTGRGGEPPALARQRNTLARTCFRDPAPQMAIIMLAYLVLIDLLPFMPELKYLK